MASKKQTRAAVPQGLIQLAQKADPNVISINFQPLNVRNDCSSLGEWKVSESKKIGNKLHMAILAVRQFYGKLGKSTNQWLQIFFVPAPKDPTILPKNVVCVTYVKNQSLAELTAELIITPNPEQGIWETSFIPKENEKGKYHYVSFFCRSRNEDEKFQLEAISKFLKEEGHRLYDPSLPPTMFPYSDEESLEIAMAKVAEAPEAEKLAAKA